MTCQWWIGQTNPHLTSNGRQSHPTTSHLYSLNPLKIHTMTVGGVFILTSQIFTASHITHSHNLSISQLIDVVCSHNAPFSQHTYLVLTTSVGIPVTSPSGHSPIVTHIYWLSISTCIWLGEHTLHALDNTSWLPCIIVDALSTSVGHYTSDRFTNTQEHAHRHIVQLTHFHHIQHSIDK